MICCPRHNRWIQLENPTRRRRCPECSARDESRALISAQGKVAAGETLTPEEQVVWSRATDETNAVARFSLDGRRLDV